MKKLCAILALVLLPSCVIADPDPHRSGENECVKKGGEWKCGCENGCDPDDGVVCWCTVE